MVEEKGLLTVAGLVAPFFYFFHTLPIQKPTNIPASVKAKHTR
jgi:hypothetical protein